MLQLNETTTKVLKHILSKGYKYIARDLDDTTIYAYKKEPLFDGTIYYLSDDECNIPENAMMITAKTIKNMILENKLANISYLNFQFNQILKDKSIDTIENILKEVNMQ